MPTPLLPHAQSALVDTNRFTTKEWRDFFQRLLDFVSADDGDAAVIADILARLEALEDEAGTPFIQGLNSVVVNQGTEIVQVQLVNDEDAPGNTYYYGTGPTGTKGWFTVESALAAGAGIELEVGPDGVTTIKELGEVYQLSDLPDPVAGVITLPANSSWQFNTSLDLVGNRIVCAGACVMLGDSFATTTITSTGLGGGDALLTATNSLRLGSIGFTAPTGRLFDLNNGAAGNLLMNGVQILNTPTIGTIQNYANVVVEQSIIFNSANLTVDGTIASFVIDTCLLDGRTGQTTITVPSTAVITRRFRLLYGGFIVNPGETGINFSTSASIPDESYILDNGHFSGGGTYIAGLDHTSNKSLFFNCAGITNTTALCQYSMTGNATATVIGATGTFVKIAGTTTASSLNQKFSTATTQRATYTGAFTGNFRVVAFASMTSGNNQTLRMRIAVNGTTIAESNTLFKTTGSGEASAVGCQVIGSLNPGDYVELFVANDTAATDITVSDLNFTITRLS